MQLSSQIIAQDSPELQRKLKYAFDHPFSVISPSTAFRPQSSLLTPSVLSECFPSSGKNSCILVYDAAIDGDSLLQVLSGEQSWRVEQVVYDSKTGEVSREMAVESSSCVSLELKMQSTCCLEVRRAGKGSVLFYFLPRSLKYQGMAPSVHQGLKLLSQLDCYYSLEKGFEQQSFLDPLSMRLNDYLYGQQVSETRLLLKVGHLEDERIIQQAGKLTMPLSWQEKQEYRAIKQELYQLSSQKQLLVHHLKEEKNQVVNTINEVVTMAGLPPLAYAQISPDTLKHLKAQALADKATQVTELQNTLKGTKIRKQELLNKKQALLQQKKQMQDQQLAEMLRLKNEVLRMQAGQAGQVPKPTAKTAQNQFLTTIFSRVKNETMMAPEPRKSQVPPRQKSTQMKKVTISDGRTSLKEGKNLLKEGKDLVQVQDEKSEAFLAIDFETEKQLHHKLTLFQEATAQLQRLIGTTEDINFLEQTQK